MLGGQDELVPKLDGIGDRHVGLVDNIWLVEPDEVSPVLRRQTAQELVDLGASLAVRT